MQVLWHIGEIKL